MEEPSEDEQVPTEMAESDVKKMENVESLHSGAESHKSIAESYKSIAESQASVAESKKSVVSSIASKVSEVPEDATSIHSERTVRSTKSELKSITSGATFVSQSTPRASMEELSETPATIATILKKQEISSIKGIKLVNAEEEPSIKTIPKNPLEEMNDVALVATVEELQKNTKILAMENSVFIHFLEKNDPSLLGGMESVLTKAEIKSQRNSMTATRKLTLTRYSRRESTLLWNPPSITTLLSTDTRVSLDREGPRINLTQRIDLVLREKEEIKTAAEIIEKKYYLARHKLNAQLEEMAIRESELRATLETFENVFINCTVEKYSQSSNPAEKFCRYMEEWFKNSRLTVDKIRLRTSSLKVQYQKICAQLSQKQVLGENLQEVDFEQLHIENKNLRTKIEQRNLLLLELKKMHGKANLLLSQLKKQLIKQSNNLRNIQQDIKDKEEKIIKFDEECDKVSLELDKMKTEYDQIKMKSETYQVPQILDYVKSKAEVDVVKKNLKIWLRRKQLKEVSLNSAVREMKVATGCTTPEPFWFMDPRLNYPGGTGSLESTFEFEFESKKKKALKSASKRKISSTIFSKLKKL